MSEAFDPYHRWLGIQSKDQPPHHYRLLGIDLFEADPEVVRDAAERQMAHVRNYQLGKHSAISQKILNELAAAKACLLDRDKKAAYDAAIKAKLSPIKSAEEQFDLLLPPPPPAPLPALPEAQRLPDENAIKLLKTPYLIAKKGPRRRNKNWPLYFGVGAGVILGGILVTVFAMRGGKPYSAMPNSSNWITQLTEGAEKNPPNQPSGGEISGNDKPAEQISGVNLPPPPPADAPSDSGDNRGIAAEEPNADSTSTATTQSKPADSRSPIIESQPAEPIGGGNLPNAKADDHGSAAVNNPAPVAIALGGSPVTPKNKPYSPPMIPVSTINLSLPTGKSFDSQIFNVDLKSLEDGFKDQLEKQSKDKENIGKLITLSSSNGQARAWAEHDKGRLDGVYLAYYNDRIPMIYANYTDGSRNGIIKKWNENGERVYWCQYLKGPRNGFCCYFKDDILRIIIEMQYNKIKAAHLCRNSELEKSFQSPDQAKTDENAKMFIDEIDKIESELQAVEKLYKAQVIKVDDKARKQLSAKRNQESRDNIQDRINQRGQERQKIKDKISQ